MRIYSLRQSVNVEIQGCLREVEIVELVAELQVSKRLQDGRGNSDPLSWNWQSSGDIFLNGAFFRASGAPLTSEVYATAMNDVTALPATMVATMTADAGPLACTPGAFC